MFTLRCSLITPSHVRACARKRERESGVKRAKDGTAHFSSLTHNTSSKTVSEHFTKSTQFIKTLKLTPKNLRLTMTYLFSLQAVEETMTKVCKCHGLTGACTVRICWKSLPKVQSVGKILKQRYSSPVRLVQGSKSAREAQKAAIPQFARRLVYLKQSPDFCQINATLGTYGTARRVCHTNSHGDDSCDLLCCGNGQYEERNVVRRQCECRFVWCCDVKCSTCLYARKTYHCKDPLLH